MREASLDDLSKDLTDINKIGGQLNNDVKKMELDLSSWTTPPESEKHNSKPSKPEESISIKLDSQCPDNHISNEK
jgi:hypothetical protein